MARKEAVFDNVIVNTSFDFKAEAKKPRDPELNMKSMRLANFEMPEYRIKNGYPRLPPRVDVHTKTLASARGVIVRYRPLARDISTGADARWVADPYMFNELQLEWNPIQSNVGQMRFVGGEVFSPTFVRSYQYRIGKELFSVPCINFDADSGDHMVSRFGSAMGGGGGYSVVMALSLNSVFGNNDGVGFNGIWCPGSQTPVGRDDFDEPVTGTNFSLLLQGRALWVAVSGRNRKKAVNVADLMARQAPMYLAFVVGYPKAKVYVGKGPDNIRKGDVFTGHDDSPAWTNDIALGRSNGSINHTADMALMDLGLYADKLNHEDVKREFSRLSRIYGGER